LIVLSVIVAKHWTGRRYPDRPVQHISHRADCYWNHRLWQIFRRF